MCTELDKLQMDDSERLSLITEVYDAFYESTETFEGDPAESASIIYLLGAIAKGTSVELCWDHDSDEAFLLVLMSLFSEQHPVWRFVLKTNSSTT